MEAVTVPDGYELIDVQQPDGTVVTVRRKIATWQLAHRDSLMSSRPSSSTPSFRTVISRTSDGRLARVQRPVRDVPASPGTCSRLSQARSAARRASVCSSVFSVEPARDTMRSTMTIVEGALAEQLSCEPTQRGRRDVSTFTTASGTAISGTSGDIQIGHMEEVNEYGNDSDYASSDYDEELDSCSEDGQIGDEFTKSGYRKSYGSCALFEIANFTQPKLVDIEANQFKAVDVDSPRPKVIDMDATQSNVVDIDAKALPSPPSTAYFPTRDTVSWGYAARLRAHERYALQGLSSSDSKSSLWARRLGQGSSYLMAGFSIILPAAFLALGILLMSMNGRAVSHFTSTLVKVVGIADTIWPVVFAAVVAQCFKTWFLVKADRWRPLPAQVTQPGKMAQRLQAMCLLVFLVWCLSPFGSQALQRACGYKTTTNQTSTDVWYVDRTGYNPMWSANSTLAMSAADRSELVQLISEKYIGSLAPSTVLSDKSGQTAARSLSAPALSYAGEPTSGRKVDAINSASLLSLQDSNWTRIRDSVVDSSVETLSFSLITSRFEFTCNDWNLRLRHIGNTTSATNMSYSESQTLGMSMSGGDNSTSPMNTVHFASLNKITNANGTTLASRSINSTRVRNETWEYSSIQCEFQQNFYSKPIQCKRDQSTGTRACTQSAQQSLIVSSTGLSGTELGDFAQAFVYANPSTGEREPTATEKYVQNGGSVDPIFLTNKRATPALLNLSTTVSPTEFARNFGDLFNTWVSLGYCPQCTSDILAGNNTNIPANLQPFYRQVNATTMGAGEPVFVVNWAWIYVLIAFSASLLVVAVASVAIEAIVLARSVSEKDINTEGHGDERGYQSGQPAHLQLPKSCSNFTSCQPSPQWAKGVVQDIEAATGYTEQMRISPVRRGQGRGIDLTFLSVNRPRDIFDRMSGGKEFDASELSLSEYICQHATGKRDFKAIPVFPSRLFRHSFIVVNSRSIQSPKDLSGKTIGVQLYTMTAAVWIRALLKQHGVDLSSVRWIQGSMESGQRYGKPMAMPLVSPVNISENDTGKSLSQLLEEGEIDATIGADLPPCLGKAEHVKRLFPDFKEVEKAYFRETGIFPIMHAVVVRREILEKYPWIATSLYNALDDSKEVGRLRMRFCSCLRYMLPWLPSELDEIDEVFPGGDPWINGVEPNRKTLEALVEALHDQGMIADKPTLEELFAPVHGQNWKIGLGTAMVTK
ncbi:hypothetical protein N0V93_001369 [Gnomoniopsis smithogilvyi]|uniref:SsuA/THI5-like domain-containing protein n=1 Tax=Gnomoniopsis smithogilvyi TaxID=1191159 RepID=A0A9W9D2J7_9PEZI|nr:hypothetical protein N0V93_001369 [Gnomoniopsis smithogilvyi]